MYSGAAKITKKQGFSLVELMVAMALIIFMLSIMSQAFVIATTCMQGLKGVGELIGRSKPVMQTLQRDLAAYHFEGNRRLSDPTFWDNGPPTQGYFTIWQDKPESNNEAPPNGTSDGVSIVRSGPDANHMLIFTSRLNGQEESEFFSAELPPDDPSNVNYKFSSLSSVFNNFPNFQTNTSSKKYGKTGDVSSLVATGSITGVSNLTEQNSTRYENNFGTVHSEWAEIAYFLEPNGKFANGSAPGAPLGNLYRRQKIVLPTIAGNSTIDIPVSPPVICSYGPLKPGSERMLWSYDLVNGKHSTFDNFYEFSSGAICSGTKLYFPTPEDLTAPFKRMTRANSQSCDGGMSAADPLTPYPVGHPGFQKDLLLENVISFDIRILVDTYLDFIPLAKLETSLGYTNINKTVNPVIPVIPPTFRKIFDTWSKENDLTGILVPPAPFPDNIYDQGAYDSTVGHWVPSTGSGINSNRVPYWHTTLKKGPQIHAIQVSIRIWDEKTQKAREFKLIQRL